MQIIMYSAYTRDTLSRWYVTMHREINRYIVKNILKNHETKSVALLTLQLGVRPLVRCSSWGHNLPFW